MDASSIRTGHLESRHTAGRVQSEGEMSEHSIVISMET